MAQHRWFTAIRVAQPHASIWSGLSRDRVAVLLAVVTIIGIAVAFVCAKNTSFLMPGPLTSAHGVIKNCSGCHSKSGTDKLTWVKGLMPSDPHADSKACLTCHKLPATAFNAHTASEAVLRPRTERIGKRSTSVTPPRSAVVQSVAFPTRDMVANGLNCASCHQEHRGVTSRLTTVSNEQCRSCHVLKFDSFDGNHPNFDSYPFKRRTRIIYDHAAHFEKHYPEVAKKDQTKRIPATCATCHNSNADKRLMAVAPFEQACASCHLDQIKGKERASGPKGIAFLTLPGLDLQSLAKKNAHIGEWPDASDAVLTPFMRVMIGRNDHGRNILKAIDTLNLQDLTTASDDQIRAVANLTWEIKTLFHALIAGKASDVLGDLNIGTGAKLSVSLVADLTASIPRDVLIRAQQQWLPHLAGEIADRNGTLSNPANSTAAVSSQPVPDKTDNRQSLPETSQRPADGDAVDGTTAATDDPQDGSERADTSSGAEREPTSDIERPIKRDPPACSVRVFGQCLVFNDQTDNEKTAASSKSASPSDADDADRKPEPPPNSKATFSTDSFPGAMRAGLKDVAQAAQGDTAPKQPPDPAGDQTDDLLVFTPEEARNQKSGVHAPSRADATSAPIDKTVGASTLPITASNTSAPIVSIASDIDGETWAEYGGWYGQDNEISYRPIGHKDKFLFAWLFLTGPQATKGDTSPAASVFNSLTTKDAQGSCTKCHSVDTLANNARVVNFSQASIETKQGRFTQFIHEPHFRNMDDSGCLTCHTLNKASAYSKSYEHGDPLKFASNFGAVKKDLCQSCHNTTMAKQDCTTCHTYHIDGVTTPITNTKNPIQ